MYALTSHPPIPSALPRSIAGSEGFELRELRHFAIVARSGSFRRAAQELQSSQPTLSHQIRKLEDALGTRLLVRHARGVTLTPSGTCLLDRLDTIMHLLAAPLQQEGEEAAHGTVSLAMPAEVAPPLVPPLIAAFQRRWPQVTLDVREAASGTLEAWVLNGRVDIALIQDPPELDALRFEPLLSEKSWFRRRAAFARGSQRCVGSLARACRTQADPTPRAALDCATPEQRSVAMRRAHRTGVSG